MKTEKAKLILTAELNRAADFHRRGDVTMRNQVLRNIEDFPLPEKYLKAAIKNAGI